MTDTTANGFLHVLLLLILSLTNYLLVMHRKTLNERIDVLEATLKGFQNVLDHQTGQIVDGQNTNDKAPS